jgi:hypothetical protein
MFVFGKNLFTYELAMYDKTPFVTFNDVTYNDVFFESAILDSLNGTILFGNDTVVRLGNISRLFSSEGES